ncbi:hypothetical protein NSK_007705 [Nannochloropsis salina CCMP1776]|uniref:NADP-dependent oxidoreductase domain-containing protein n=1 Tax=Nannochloropsis salina CCMP1776 TaxID=1027361 RepID=A0A4D9CPH7_9STRA|nr:hypothetical protein NSK_007705 [Nannochloropsis salina CCMP1776]|eukprot:TFJ81062.1 hypothetical protein NSK_007705 [Nannochloropsis salina CCMP1776]
MSPRTGIRRIGFGCARITPSLPHLKALTAAIQHGIRVFDTAPNYGHAGASERAVGQALATHFQGTNDLDRDDITICSKFGYYRPVEGHAPGPDSVPVGNKEEGGLYYSLHPEVMEHELKGSLARLQVDALDILYVHNPEHVLADIVLRHETGETSFSDDASLQAALREEKQKMRERLVHTFEALEGVVGSGRVRKGYGVSSNGFALSSKEGLHLSLAMVLDAAAEGARRAGKETPSLKAIQLPLNLLEPGGVVVAAQAREKGLEVFANRPLTAVSQGGLYRLVNKAALSGEPPGGYMEACRTALEVFNPTSLFEGRAEKELTEEELETREGCRIIQDLIRDMNRQLTSFTSTETYTQELERRIIPMIASTFESLDEDAADALQAFFVKYGEMVRYHAAMRAVEACKAAGHVLGGGVGKAGEALHEYALRWSLDKVPRQLSGVLVGMPSEEYVHEAVRVASTERGGES